MNPESRGPVARAINNLAIAVVSLAAVFGFHWWSSQHSSPRTVSEPQVAAAPAPTDRTSVVAVAPVAPDEKSIRAAAEQWIQSLHAGRKNATPVPKSLQLYAPNMQISKDLADAYADFVNSDGDNNGTVDSVHGATANVTMTYGLPSENKGSLRWRIDGSLHFIHGSSGWLIDKEWWVNRTITGVQSADGSVANVTDSRISGDESVRFQVFGNDYEWRRLPKLGWKVAELASSEPTAAPMTLYSPEPATAQAPAQQAPRVTQGYIAPPYYASNSDAGCEDVSVSGVYADGEILELDDGRRLRVGAGDTPTASVWVPPFDGLICEDGNRFINKDDNESVDLQP